jgi:hypothetical protein
MYPSAASGAGDEAIWLLAKADNHHRGISIVTAERHVDLAIMMRIEALKNIEFFRLNSQKSKYAHQNLTFTPCRAIIQVPFREGMLIKPRIRRLDF